MGRKFGDPTDPRHRDGRRHRHPDDPAQHDHPDEKVVNILDLQGQRQRYRYKSLAG
jgi:uncharacterized short protein YbdD (DUF466 family)